MENSRTKNTLKNMSTGAIVQIINKLMAFAVRTVFIRILNTEYLGVNGLFTNILTMLSFTELGIGTAIIYSMYKPVAENDKEKIKSLMRLYKKSYNIIGIVVFVLGLAVIPFMKVLIKEAPNITENITFIYLLFLINTSSSYFFTYKKSIISAHQKESIINKIDSVFYLVKSIVEIITLIVFKNYILYLLINIVGTIVENITMGIKAEKMFPYLKETKVNKLERKETNTIFQNVKSLIVYKFGSVIMDGTDNIIISSMVNVGMVGLCSNYIMIINSIKSIIFSAINGITASIGNLNVEGDAKKKEKIFYQLTFMDFWIFGFASIAFMILLNPFIEIWLGQEYVLEIGVSIALSISFFINGLRNPGYSFRVTSGLFQQGKMTPYIGAIVNIITSVIFCKLWGIVGVFIGTSVAQLCSYSWIDPYLLHKYEFKTSPLKYLKKYSIYFFTFIFTYLLCYFMTSFTLNSAILAFVIKTIVVITIPNIIIVVLFRKTEEYKCLKERMKNIIKEHKK